MPKVLEAREAGSDLVDIAQIFQRSGTLTVTWKDTGLDDICKLAGKKVGAWGFGNEYEVTAGLSKNCGLTPGLENGGDPATQYQQVTQNFDMVAFLNSEIDAAEAMQYNEYAQVLEATNPATGDLYKPEDMNIFDWDDYRSSMLQDALFVRESWLERRATTATSPSGSSAPRSRAGSTAVTTRPTASSTRSTRAASSPPATRPG